MPVIHYRKPNRLKGFDYSSHRFYFITICVDDRKKYFGDIHNNIMCVNKLGAIVYRQWEWLETQYPYILSHTFILMPNHVHGIIEIKNPNDSHRVVGRDRSRPVPTKVTKIKSLSELIGAFKTTSSKLIHQAGFTKFQWQRSFYDQIIPYEKIFGKIYRYIINNPTLWDRDRNNPKFHKYNNICKTNPIQNYSTVQNAKNKN